MAFIFPSADGNFQENIDRIMELERGRRLSRIENSVEETSLRFDTLNDIQSASLSLKDITKELYGLSSVFRSTKVLSSDEESISALASNRTPIGLHDLEVLQTAQSQIIASKSIRSTAKKEQIFKPSKLVFKFNDENIPLDFPGGTVEDFAKSIQENSSLSKWIRSTVVKRRENEKIIILRAQKTGDKNRILLVSDSSGVTASLGLFRPNPSISVELLYKAEKANLIASLASEDKKNPAAPANNTGSTLLKLSDANSLTEEQEKPEAENSAAISSPPQNNKPKPLPVSYNAEENNFILQPGAQLNFPVFKQLNFAGKIKNIRLFFKKEPLMLSPKADLLNTNTNTQAQTAKPAESSDPSAQPKKPYPIGSLRYYINSYKPTADNTRTDENDSLQRESSAQGDYEIFLKPGKQEGESIQFPITSKELFFDIVLLDEYTLNTYERPLITLQSLSITNHTDDSIYHVSLPLAQIKRENKDPFTPRKILRKQRKAKLRFEGLEIERESNQIDDLISGVILTLKQKTKKPIQLNVQKDNETILQQVSRFQESYNTLMQSLNLVLAPNEESLGLSGLSDELKERVGIFQGSRELQQFKNLLHDSVANLYPTRAKEQLSFSSQLGIESVFVLGNSSDLSSSTLTFNKSTFGQVLEAYPFAVADFFASSSAGNGILDTGLAFRMDKILKAYTEVTGIFQLRRRSLADERKRFEAEQSSEEERLERRQAKLEEDFSQTQSTLEQQRSLQGALQGFGGNR